MGSLFGSIKVLVVRIKEIQRDFWFEAVMISWTSSLSVHVILWISLPPSLLFLSAAFSPWVVSGGISVPSAVPLVHILRGWLRRCATCPYSVLRTAKWCLTKWSNNYYSLNSVPGRTAPIQTKTFPIFYQALEDQPVYYNTNGSTTGINLIKRHDRTTKSWEEYPNWRGEWFSPRQRQTFLKHGFTSFVKASSI